MKTRYIEAALRAKFLGWQASIQDESVKALVAQNTLITGGCITSMLLDEKVNDYDFYFSDAETVRAVARYYIKQYEINPPPRHSAMGEDVKIELAEEAEQGRVRFRIKGRSAGVASEGDAGAEYQFFEQADPDSTDALLYVQKVSQVLSDSKTGEGDKKYRPVMLTDNAITLSGGIQLVIRFYGSARDIHSNFDFVHCTNSWKSAGSKLTLRRPAVISTLTRELVYQGSKYPICSLLRIRKFIERGWTIHAGQILEIALQVAALDLNNPTVLEDQLTGVDMAYFKEVLEKAKRGGDSIDLTYLMQLMEVVF